MKGISLRRGFPGSSAGKESTCNAGDPGLISGSERSAGEGIGYPLLYYWASLWLSWLRICLQCRRPRFNSWIKKFHWRRDRLPTPVFLDFPRGSANKESSCNAGDLGLIPGLGRSPGEGKSYPFQYSGLENFLDCIIHGVTKSHTWLNDFHFQAQKQLKLTGLLTYRTISKYMSVVVMCYIAIETNAALK